MADTSRAEALNEISDIKEFFAKFGAQLPPELEAQRHIVPATPRIVGGALVVPSGWFQADKPAATPALHSVDPLARSRIELLAMEAVAAAECAMGFSPRDVSAEKCGWDITSAIPRTGDTLPDDRLIEVKGRAKGATTITLTKNEIIAEPAFRAGYPDYLRAAGLSEVAAVAVPGFTGILILTGAGGLVGYRQARAGHVVRRSGTARFMT